MNADKMHQPNPQHQPETASTVSLQSFEDPEGGLPLDSPLVKARQDQQRGRQARPRSIPSENDTPKPA